MKKTQKRHALLMSALSLLLCVSMLVGTTFAWFTDEVTSGMNTIAAGNLDIELLADGVKVESETKLFSEVEKWEPGVVVYENLQIANVGTLALKYQMSLNFGKENTLNGHKLSEVLQIAVVDKIAQGADRAAVLASVQDATPLEDFTITGSLTAGAKTEEKAVVIFWAPGENDNWYNANNGQKTSDEKPLSIEFGVKLVATQLMSEDDSFGTDYDKDAWVNGFDVFTAQDLQAAINNGETAIDLMADIETAESIVIPEGATVALNLNGKTLTGTMHKSNGAVINNKGNLTIAGGTVKSTAPNGGSALQNAGTAKVENATLNGASNADGSWPSYAVNNSGKLTLTNTNITSVHGGVASYGDDAVVTMNNTNLDMSGIPGFTNHGLYTYNNGKIVVNGGNIANNAADQNATGGSVINGTVTVNAGTFNGRIENYYGTPVIKGGTFSVNPNASFVAAGYKANDNGNGTWTVLFPQESFEDLIENANPGETVNVPAGNFTMSGNNDIVIVGSGEDTVINFTNSIENVNISNATIIGEPRLAVKSGQSAVFNNVSFEGTKAWGSVQGTAEFVGCTFTGLFHIDSSAATTTIKFTDCTFDAYSVIKLGGSAKYILEDCTVEALAADATGAWGKEWLITYCDTTFTNCELGRVVRAGSPINIVMNGCVDAEGKAVDANIVHKNASPNVLIDGVPVVFSTEALQAALDKATSGTTIKLAPGVAYDAVDIKPTAANVSKMVCNSHPDKTYTDAEEFKAHMNNGEFHHVPYYTTELNNVKIIGAKGATIAGFNVASSAGSKHDYILDADRYIVSYLNISDLTFENVAFTGKVNIESSLAESSIEGVTFDGCSFTTGGTAESNGQAIRYYNENNDGKVKDIVVKNCSFKNCRQGVYVQNVNGVTVIDSTFDTTGHNAIGIQGNDINLKKVVIIGNTFNNIGDRVIRFNTVAADSDITIQNNVATNSGDANGEVMKATSIAPGVVTNISGNTWCGTVVNTELQDK